MDIMNIIETAKRKNAVVGEVMIYLQGIQQLAQEVLYVEPSKANQELKSKSRDFINILKKTQDSLKELESLVPDFPLEEATTIDHVSN